MNGMVGIGIKPSIYTLDISGGNSSSDFNALRINTEGGATTGYGQKILFTNTQSGALKYNGEIATYRENSDNNNSYSLRLSSGNNAFLRECMRLTGAGYVGIGTTSPQEILDVNGNFALRNGSLRLTNGDVSMNGNLYVNRTSTFIGDVSMNGNLYVNNKTTFIGDVSMNTVIINGIIRQFNF
jgi:hypothetical protein